CGLCVDVCPTGIDIRNGSQLECVNCTVCIDTCDEVMEKIHRDKSLIGFYSEEMIKENKKPTFTARMKGYSVVIAVLFGVLAWFIYQRKDVDVTVMRTGGMLYQEQPGHYISNMYNADIINKTKKKQNIQLVADDPAVKIKYIQAAGTLDKESSTKVIFFLMVPLSRIHAAKTDITLNIVEHGKVLNTIKTTFIGPYDED
ncbi:MAG: FixG Ig-like domain-containing protein, partial [Mucilaginibacter sp.]